MPDLLLYYAHPGHRHSRVNRRMYESASDVNDITLVDLYAEYPRNNINVEKEQTRLLEHNIIVFQFPLFWYSSPALIKQWQDLVLEYGFAYGPNGTSLVGKSLALAITAGGPEDAYTHTGYQKHELRTFLTPLEQTAKLCGMHFMLPYVLYSTLVVNDDTIEAHVNGYIRYLNELKSNPEPFDSLGKAQSVLDHHSVLSSYGEE
ncbi:MAG: NAD(P)H-dependent oxidoreductase [Gammaproteobacteria bacterium]|nr:NAD(P)H-dependent oxidoreductase [Gammaproteobacteria bacterium]